MTKKTKKTTQANKRGRKSKVTAEIESKMFLLYVDGMSMNKIAKKYGMTQPGIAYIAKKYNWDDRKENIQVKVAEGLDENLVEELIKSQDKQLQALGMMMSTIYKDIQEDYENAHLPGYTRKIKVNSTADIERIFKTFFMVLHQGIDQSKNDNVVSGKVELSKEDRALLLRSLAAGTAVIVDDDDVDGALDIEKAH